MTPMLAGRNEAAVKGRAVELLSVPNPMPDGAKNRGHNHQGISVHRSRHSE